MALAVAHRVNCFPVADAQDDQTPIMAGQASVLEQMVTNFGLDRALLESPDVVRIWDQLEHEFPVAELEYEVQKLQSQKPTSVGTSKHLVAPQSRDWESVGDAGDGYGLRVRPLSMPEALQIDTVKQYSGYFDIDNSDKHLFFWFFESRNDPANDPVILWLNGGPGCSSMTGLFFENGPSSIGEDLVPVYNNFSWNSNASVIYLDEPVNTGFSYSAASESVGTSEAAAEDVYVFLDLFFRKFHHLRNNALHVAGESYAGHYIPAAGHEILRHADRTFNFKSVMIGNGITDAYKQVPSYRAMICGEGGYPPIVSPEECDQMEVQIPRCQAAIDICYKHVSSVTCVAPIFLCQQLNKPFSKTGRNAYDIRIKCGEGEMCYEQLNYITDYLNKPEVQLALGVEVENFEACAEQVGTAFALHGDVFRPHQQDVVELLANDIAVLIYAGDKDYICNWLGNHYWTEQLEWDGMYGFQAAPMEKLTVGSGTAGEVKSFDNLTFYRIYDAGHMVPYNQPEIALHMVNTWISGDYKYGL